MRFGTPIHRDIHRHPTILLLLLLLLGILSACSSSRQAYRPDKKYSPRQLQHDFDIFRGILEQRHPSLYWYSPRTVMDSAFDAARQQLQDSLTEFEFRKILAPVTALIQCGHTSIGPSRAYSKYLDTLSRRSHFPFSIKTWNDTTVLVTGRTPALRDRRGLVIDSLNGHRMASLLDSLRLYIPADGGNRIAQDQLLSTGSYFGNLYTAVFGWERSYRLAYHDSTGAAGTLLVQQAPPVRDSARARSSGRRDSSRSRPVREPRQKIRQRERSFQLHPEQGYALMELNSFASKLTLKRFFRRSFRSLDRQKIPRLIIDLRLNGGGRVDIANDLTRYLAARSYRMADSLFAVSLGSRYSRYIEFDFWSRLFIGLVTRKKEGRYHYRYYERHRFKPRKRHHFDGEIYLLSGGRSYSATVLTLAILKGQSNVRILGEPSGGAAYGSSAWLLPKASLPATGIRLRLPLFRLVIDRQQPHDGSGVRPDINVGPSVEAIRGGRDYKMEKLMQLLKLAPVPGSLR
ncbi:S41 family peptidase [Niabella terrae]